MAYQKIVITHFKSMRGWIDNNHQDEEQGLKNKKRKIKACYYLELRTSHD